MLDTYRLICHCKLPHAIKHDTSRKIKILTTRITFLYIVPMNICLGNKIWQGLLKM